MRTHLRESWYLAPAARGRLWLPRVSTAGTAGGRTEKLRRWRSGESRRCIPLSPLAPLPPVPACLRCFLRFSPQTLFFPPSERNLEWGYSRGRRPKRHIGLTWGLQRHVDHRVRLGREACRDSTLNPPVCRVSLGESLTSLHFTCLLCKVDLRFTSSCLTGLSR